MVWTETEKDELLEGLKTFMEANSNEIGRMVGNMLDRMDANARFFDLLVKRGVVKCSPVTEK